MTDATAEYVGADLHDGNGHKIGKITDVIFDDRTAEPEWYVVKVGMLHGNHVVPVGSVSATEHGAAVPFDKETVQHAPKLDGPAPTEPEEHALNAHYRVQRP
jgi:uncharacterized protein YrrD